MRFGDGALGTMVEEPVGGLDERRLADWQPVPLRCCSVDDVLQPDRLRQCMKCFNSAITNLCSPPFATILAWSSYHRASWDGIESRRIEAIGGTLAQQTVEDGVEGYKCRDGLAAHSKSPTEGAPMRKEQWHITATS